MSTALFDLDAENEALAEVTGLDFDNYASASQAQLDAIASANLRAILALQAEREERQKAMEFELEFIRVRYGREFDRLDDEIMRRETVVKGLAQIADFGKKKKSRNVGYGVYGSRVKKGGLRVVDEGAVIDWASSSCPTALRVKVSHAIDKAELDSYFAASGEAIPGTSVEDDRIEWFARPEKP